MAASLPVSDAEHLAWYAVRCVFASAPPAAGGNRYEERITLWRATTAEHAIQRAEAEATAYANTITGTPDTFLESYWLHDEPADGTEIFSLIRDSNLEPTAYLDTFFDTGNEREQHI